MHRQVVRGPRSAACLLLDMPSFLEPLGERCRRNILPFFGGYQFHQVAMRIAMTASPITSTVRIWPLGPVGIAPPAISAQDSFVNSHIFGEDLNGFLFCHSGWRLGASIDRIKRLLR